MVSYRFTHRVEGHPQPLLKPHASQGKAQGPSQQRMGQMQGMQGRVQDENAAAVASAHNHPVPRSHHHPQPRSSLSLSLPHFQPQSQEYRNCQSQFTSPPPFSHPTDIVKGQGSARLFSVSHPTGILAPQLGNSLAPTRPHAPTAAKSDLPLAAATVATTGSRVPLGSLDGNSRSSTDPNVPSSTSTTEVTALSTSALSTTSASLASTRPSTSAGTSSRCPSPLSSPSSDSRAGFNEPIALGTAAPATQSSQTPTSASSRLPPSSPPPTATAAPESNSSSTSETGPAPSTAPHLSVVARPSTPPPASSITLPSLRSLPLHLPPTPLQPSASRCPPANHLATPAPASRNSLSRSGPTSVQASVTPRHHHPPAAGSTPASESLATPYAPTHSLPYVNAYSYPYGPTPVGYPVYAAHPAHTPQYYLSTPAAARTYPSLPSHAFETPMPPRKPAGRVAGPGTGGKKVTSVSAKKTLLGTSPATASTPRETPRKDNHRALPLKMDMRLDPHYRTWGDEPLEPAERFQNAYIVNTIMMGDLGHIMRPAAWRWGPHYPETYLRRHPMHPQNRESQSEKSTDASAYKRVSLNPFDYLYYPNGPKVDKKPDVQGDAATPAKAGEPSPQPGSSVRKSAGKNRSKANKDEPSTRASFTEHQVHVLQIALGFCKTPSAEAKQRLGAWLGIPTQKVNTWCMNYRTDPSPKRKRDELEKFAKLSPEERAEATARGVAPLTAEQEYHRHRAIQRQRLKEEALNASLKVMDKTVYDEDLCKPRRYPQCWLRRYNHNLANEEAVVQAIMLGLVTRDQFLSVHAPADVIHPYPEGSLIHMDELDYDIVTRPAVDPNTDRHKVHVPLESTNPDELAAVRRQQAANGEEIYDPPQGKMELVMAERDREVGMRTHRQSTYVSGQTSIDNHDHLLACIPTDPFSSPPDKASYYDDDGRYYGSDMDDDAGPGDTPVKAGKRPAAILGERDMNAEGYRSAGSTNSVGPRGAEGPSRLALPLKRKVPDLARATGNNIRSSLSGYKQRQFGSADDFARKRQRSDGSGASIAMHRPSLRGVPGGVRAYDGLDRAFEECTDYAPADVNNGDAPGEVAGAGRVGVRVSPRHAHVDLHHPDRPTRTVQHRPSFTRSGAEDEDADADEDRRSTSPDQQVLQRDTGDNTIPAHLTPPGSQSSRSSSSHLITPNVDRSAVGDASTAARHVDVFDSHAHAHDRSSHPSSAYALECQRLQNQSEAKGRNGGKRDDELWQRPIDAEDGEEDEFDDANGQGADRRHDNAIASLLLALRN